MSHHHRNFDDRASFHSGSSHSGSSHSGSSHSSGSYSSDSYTIYSDASNPWSTTSQGSVTRHIDKRDSRRVRIALHILRGPFAAAPSYKYDKHHGHHSDAGSHHHHHHHHHHNHHGGGGGRVGPAFPARPGAPPAGHFGPPPPPLRPMGPPPFRGPAPFGDQPFVQLNGPAGPGPMNPPWRGQRPPPPNVEVVDDGYWPRG